MTNALTNSPGTAPAYGRDVTAAAVLSVVANAPLLAMELSRPVAHPQSTAALFTTLWLLAALSIAFGSAAIRRIRSGQGMSLTVVHASLFVALLTVWAFGVIDQLPCFLGVPNCD